MHLCHLLRPAEANKYIYIHLLKMDWGTKLALLFIETPIPVIDIYILFFLLGIYSYSAAAAHHEETSVPAGQRDVSIDRILLAISQYHYYVEMISLMHAKKRKTYLRRKPW